MLLIRPEQDAERFLKRLRPDVLRGVQTVVSPILKIVETGENVSLDDAKGIIFTSRQGVRFAPPSCGLPVYCVGERTAAAARDEGWPVVVTAPDAEHLIASLIKRRPPAPLMHLSGVHVRGDIAGDLSSAGLLTQRIALYDQVFCDLTEQANKVLSGEETILVPLFSPRSAGEFVRQVKNLRNVVVVAISAAVAKNLPVDQLKRLDIIPQPTGKVMVRHIEKLLIGTSL